MMIRGGVIVQQRVFMGVAWGLCGTHTHTIIVVVRTTNSNLVCRAALILPPLCTGYREELRLHHPNLRGLLSLVLSGTHKIGIDH